MSTPMADVDHTPPPPGAASPRPACLLLSGGSGAGKSTIALLAAYFFRQRIGETAALSTDEFYRMFDPHWTANNRDWWRLAWEHCLASARWLLQNGVRLVVIEGNGLYAREQVVGVLQAVGPLASIYHVTLEITLEAATERLRLRGDLERHPPGFVAGWLDLIRQHRYTWTQVIDTSAKTPEQTLEAIYNYMVNSPGLPADLP